MNKKAAWTVMVYLAGDNNLTTECLFALTEMKKADPGGEINVLAQFDPRDEYLPTHRYEINRKSTNTSLFDDIIDKAGYNAATGEVHFKRESRNANRLASDRRAARRFRSAGIEEVNLTGAPGEDEVVTDDTDTGSPVTLYNFISFCLESYPADKYMVVLSGHAGGTQRDYLMQDESSTGSLTFNEMKHVFERIKRDRNGETIDIVGMDNCLMSMGEICYELHGLADIVIGCESYSPASGWPYRQILERLRRDFTGRRRSKYRNAKAEAAEAAKAVVEEYVNYYSPYWISGMSVTQSALDLSKVDKLRKLVDSLAQELEQKLVSEKVAASRGAGRKRKQSFQDDLLLAHWESQSYNGELFVDLYDFCDCLERRAGKGAIASKCRQLKRFISGQFVLKSCYSGALYQYSHGVSLYFPWSHVANNYFNLSFVRNSDHRGWASFLQTYTELTRREPRGAPSGSRVSEISNPIGRGMGFRMTSDRMTSDRMTSDRMTSDRMTSDRMTSDRMTSDRMTSDRMTSDRMTSDRMTSDRMTSDRMSSGLSGNPVHSMRNPPVVFVPTDCIRERRHVLAGQDRLLCVD